VTKLCALAGIKASEYNVGKCELVHFDKLKAAESKAFIIACHPKFMKISKVAHLENPRGGKSIEEAKCGVDNCISVAFGVRNEKSRLLAMTYLHDDTNVIGANISAPIISRITLHGNSTEIKPSDILQIRSKVELLLSIFDPKGKLSTQDFHDAMTDDTSEILPKADLLFAMLKARFQTHKKQGEAMPAENMCLSWASKNLALVATWMIVASHLKEDILCLDESKCLLANPISNKFLVCSNK
jgi:hypothetical protein